MNGRSTSKPPQDAPKSQTQGNICVQYPTPETQKYSSVSVDVAGIARSECDGCGIVVEVHPWPPRLRRCVPPKQEAVRLCCELQGGDDGAV